MCTIIDKKSLNLKDHLELQTIYFCDTSNSFNLLDKNFNTIIYNRYNLLTYYIDEHYDLIDISNDFKKRYNHLLYDDLIKADGTEFLYFSFFTINYYNLTINNIINNMYTYDDNSYTYKFITYLFLENEAKDNFNIVNISIYGNKLKFLLDYINTSSLDSKSISMSLSYRYKGIFDKYLKEDKIRGYSAINLKNNNTEDILRPLIKRIQESDLKELNINEILLEIFYLLENNVHPKSKSKSYELLLNSISSLLQSDLQEMSKSKSMSYLYKSALNFKNYRNFIKQLQKSNDLSDPKTIEFKKILDDEIINMSIKDKLYDLYYYIDLILFKHMILLSNIETKILDNNFYNIVIGSYINKILQKGTQSRLFPISLTSVKEDLSFEINDKTEIVLNEYTKIREKIKDKLIIIGTFTMYINGEKIPACGESCVYNYINKLLFNEDKIDVNLFPHDLKDTKLYEFYVKYFKNKTLTEQNIIIQNETIFNEFAILLMYHDNVLYTRSDKIEFIPTEENFVNLLSILFKIEEKIENMMEMTEILYEKFKNKYYSLDLKMDY
jgi:hypothetical protein